MTVDPKFIGTVLDPITMDVERGRLRAFAKAVGQRDAIYCDLGAAQAGGHPDLPVPPSFLFAIELEQPDPFAWAPLLGIDMRFVLHGEQRFAYHRMAYAGETLTASPTIRDIYSKRDGALDFVVKSSAVTDAHGEAVADLTSVIVVRSQGA